MEFIQKLLLISFCSPGLMVDTWSMTVSEAVDRKTGEDAVIPCSFTTPHQDYQGIMTIIWRTKYPFKGPIIFRCLSKGIASESGQNCTESDGRYSLSGNPRKNDISLRIDNVSFTDNKQYFCRVELEKKGENYETDSGTSLNIRVPQTLESIYIRTLSSGEFVTCDVKGTPPPAVKWIIPENISASLVSVQSSFAMASSSIPANLPNTNYTCQIHGENGLQRLSVYYSRAQEQQRQIPLALFIVFVVLSGISLILLVILGILYKKGSSKPVGTEQHKDFRKSMPIEKDDEIYANV